MIWLEEIGCSLIYSKDVYKPSFPIPKSIPEVAKNPLLIYEEVPVLSFKKQSTTYRYELTQTKQFKDEIDTFIAREFKENISNVKAFSPLEKILFNFLNRNGSYLNPDIGFDIVTEQVKRKVNSVLNKFTEIPAKQGYEQYLNLGTSVLDRRVKPFAKFLIYDNNLYPLNPIEGSKLSGFGFKFGDNYVKLGSPANLSDLVEYYEKEFKSNIGHFILKTSELREDLINRLTIRKIKNISTPQREGSSGTINYKLKDNELELEYELEPWCWDCTKLPNVRSGYEYVIFNKPKFKTTLIDIDGNINHVKQKTIITNNESFNSPFMYSNGTICASPSEGHIDPRREDCIKRIVQGYKSVLVNGFNGENVRGLYPVSELIAYKSKYKWTSTRPENLKVFDAPKGSVYIK